MGLSAAFDLIMRAFFLPPPDVFVRIDAEITGEAKVKVFYLILPNLLHDLEHDV